MVFELFNLIFSHAKGSFVLPVFVRSEIIGIFNFFRKVVLLHPITRIVMWIFVILRVSQLLATSVVTVS